MGFFFPELMILWVSICAHEDEEKTVFAFADVFEPQGKNLRDIKSQSPENG